MAYIGIVDDEKHIRQIVEAYLQNAGFQTQAMGTAEEAIDHFKSSLPDLWVIDIMLPGMDGFALCRKIREVSESPIIMISARDSEIDKVTGLELGCDDYLTKPFNPKELVARVKRHISKWDTYQHQASQISDGKIHFGSLIIDNNEREIYWDGHRTHATNKEFLFISYMISRQGVALSRQDILSHIWGDDYFGSDRAVDDLVKRIRQKMPDIPIFTIWGYGYRLNKLV